MVPKVGADRKCLSRRPCQIWVLAPGMPPATCSHLQQSISWGRRERHVWVTGLLLLVPPPPPKVLEDSIIRDKKTRGSEVTWMACLGGRGTAQTLAPHFQSPRREPAIGALAGGEPGFGATVLPSHPQAPRPKGRRKRDTEELRRSPIRNGHPECLPAVPAVPAPASNVRPGVSSGGGGLAAGTAVLST